MKKNIAIVGVVYHGVSLTSNIEAQLVEQTQANPFEETVSIPIHNYERIDMPRRLFIPKQPKPKHYSKRFNGKQNFF